MSETRFLIKRENIDAFSVQISFLLLAMANSKQEKLDLKMYDQVWSPGYLNPDRLTSELNKIFIYNQAETDYRNTSDKYYDFNEQYSNSLEKSKTSKGSASFAYSLVNASGGIELSAFFKKAESGATGKKHTRCYIFDRYKKIS
jgi:hypothetical protein